MAQPKKPMQSAAVASDKEKALATALANIEKQFGDTGLHRSQRRMLMHLSRFETMPSQRRIADDFDVSPACVARTLKSLAGEGYITRADDDADRSQDRQIPGGYPGNRRHAIRHEGVLVSRRR